MSRVIMIGSCTSGKKIYQGVLPRALLIDEWERGITRGVQLNLSDCAPGPARGHISNPMDFFPLRTFHLVWAHLNMK